MPEVGSLVWQRYGSGYVHGILLDEHPLASFERDALHREIRRTQGPASHHFGYGANGLLAVHRWQNLDERGRSLERPRPWRAWAYDAAGQLMTLDDAWRDQKAYRYDGSHQLIAIEHADGARSEYEYDALGRRVAKHHTPADGAQQTTLFMWDGDWMMQEVRTGRTSHEDRAVTYVPHPDHDGPLTRLADGQAWHYVTDHLGTPQELYDEQREVVWAADLSAYGRTARWLTRVVDNPIRFPGQYRDEESGLHYNRFRYYDPMVGRYINQDPIGLAGGFNNYTYSDSQPSCSIDSLGLQTVVIGAIGGGAVAGPPGAAVALTRRERLYAKKQ
ncbi:RHS repeat domain-containing protein [Burkholderia multivorans]|uniref:RHS repeat domain-containing protein n=1 Tax=Burkholderia multivorans TaxID=87883 RepID=UPI000B5AAB82|nr:RHS repeat-associated core domain-containing protein [Burkholderia multivorans]HEM7809814.1 RHS domain-containing protein [Burkholderia multivorans]HEM7820423.1 RHS domain-containing protein [Burkholderia multivorans]HEM7826801.1 RHS domain-containing protein [Burkholderia multivorans]